MAEIGELSLREVKSRDGEGKNSNCGDRNGENIGGKSLYGDRGEYVGDKLLFSREGREVSVFAGCSGISGVAS